MYSKDEILNIIYNNRSIEGVTRNFLPPLDIIKLLKLEKIIDEVNQLSLNKNRNININREDLDLDVEDVLVTKDDLNYASEFLFRAIGKFTPEEYTYLKSRGITDHIIKKYKLGSFSYIQDYRALEILNITTHPMLKRILGNGVEGGGIFIPLIINDRLINSVNRKIIDINKLKYSVTVPNISVWGLDEVKEDEDLWLVEGIYDWISLLEKGKKAITSCAVSLSSIQLLQIINKKPKKINIFFDNDETGLINALKFKQIFEYYKIPVITWISEVSKDPSEHFLEKNETWNKVKVIEITNDTIEKSDGEKHFKEVEMNFLNYLKSRKF